MTARDTYQTTVKATGPTKTATITANQTTAQETINANGVNVGYTTQSGNYANFATGVKNANQAKRDADFKAEHDRQVAINVARDTLRDSGDKAPA